MIATMWLMTQFIAAAQTRPLTILLLGETGAGKSTLGNLLLGETRFKQGNSPTRVTMKPQIAFKTLENGINLSVIDTEGTNDGAGNFSEGNRDLLMVLR